MDAGHGRTLIFLDEMLPINPPFCCIINDDFLRKIIYLTANSRALRQSFETVPRLEYLTGSVKMQIFCNFVSFVYAMEIRFIYY